MRRWFPSYNSQHLGLMQRLEEAVRRKDTDARKEPEGQRLVAP